MEKYKDIQWILETKLINLNDIYTFKQSCENLGIDCLNVTFIPFSVNYMPEFPRQKKSIFYVCISFANEVEKDSELKKGLFFDPQTFTIENYLEKYGDKMLNYGAEVTTFGDLMEKNYDGEQLFFIRPNDDSKSFNGEVRKFKEIAEWYERLKEIENINISLESKIIIGEPFNIKSEWRLFIVEKKVIAASKYREYFRLNKEEGCPKEVIDFAEEMCSIYVPHDVFVMDIALCGDSYYIIECGCMNSAGFYKSNIQTIIEKVSDYFIKKNF